MICQSLPSDDVAALSSDPDLALLIDRWPTLPAGVRQRIVAMVQGEASG
jgi:hypothetical protein